MEAYGLLSKLLGDSLIRKLAVAVQNQKLPWILESEPSLDYKMHVPCTTFDCSFPFCTPLKHGILMQAIQNIERCHQQGLHQIFQIHCEDKHSNVSIFVHAIIPRSNYTNQRKWQKMHSTRKLLNHLCWSLFVSYWYRPSLRTHRTEAEARHAQSQRTAWEGKVSVFEQNDNTNILWCTLTDLFWP